jgi:hypothetical protein
VLFRSQKFDFEAQKLDFEAKKLDFEAQRLDFEAQKFDFEAQKLDFEAQRLDFEARKLDFESLSRGDGYGVSLFVRIFVGDAFHIKRVGAKRGFVSPFHTQPVGTYGIKHCRVFQRTENFVFQIRFYIKMPFFSVGKPKTEHIIVFGFYGYNSWIHCLLLF